MFVRIRFVIGEMLFVPALGPFPGVSLGEAGVDILGFFDTEIVLNRPGRAVVDNAPGIEDEDGVIEIEVGETVGHVDDEAVLVAAQLMHEFDDLLLTFRIESARDLVTEKQDRVGHEFEGEGEAPPLAAGKYFDLTIAERIQSGRREDVVDELMKGFTVSGLCAESDRALDVLLHGECLIGDAELRHVADFGMFEIPLLGKIPFVPENVPGGFLIDPGDQLQQRRLAAAGWPDDGHKVAGGNPEIDLLKKVGLFLPLPDREMDVF